MEPKHVIVHCDIELHSSVDHDQLPGPATAHPDNAIPGGNFQDTLSTPWVYHVCIMASALSLPLQHLGSQGWFQAGSGIYKSNQHGLCQYGK